MNKISESITKKLQNLHFFSKKRLKNIFSYLINGISDLIHSNSISNII